MALRGRKIENFDELWCLLRLKEVWNFVYHQLGLSSTSFEKSNIGYEKVEDYPRFGTQVNSVLEQINV